LTGKVNRDRPRVIAMIQAAEEAKRDSSEGKETFLAGGLVQKAVLFDLIHFTESAERTSPGLKKRNPRIPWARLSQLRNRGLVHDYAEVNLEDVWAFVRQELPRLRRQLDHLKYAEDEDP
jgi:uncharacterized protein with HEPN domain